MTALQVARKMRRVSRRTGGGALRRAGPAVGDADRVRLRHHRRPYPEGPPAPRGARRGADPAARPRDLAPEERHRSLLGPGVMLNPLSGGRRSRMERRHRHGRRFAPSESELNAAVGGPATRLVGDELISDDMLVVEASANVHSSRNWTTLKLGLTRTGVELSSGAFRRGGDRLPHQCRSTSDNAESFTPTRFASPACVSKPKLQLVTRRALASVRFDI